MISVVFAIALSMFEVNFFKHTYEFVWFDNYTRIFRDTKTGVALWNTIRFVMVVVPAQTIISLVIAAVLNSKIKGSLIFRIVFFLPTLTSSAALTMIFMFLFSMNGPVNDFLLSTNEFLYNIGVIGELMEGPINFLYDKDYTLEVIMFMNVWSTVPFFMIIYYAGMQDIPEALYEQASIDGCGSLRKFWHVTVPHLRPITTFVLLMGIIGTFQMFDQAFIFSNGSGGPENSTLTIALLVYKYAFSSNNTMGYATAIATMLSIIIMIASYITDKINKSEALY